MNEKRESGGRESVWTWSFKQKRWWKKKFAQKNVIALKHRELRDETAREGNFEYFMFPSAANTRIPTDKHKISGLLNIKIVICFTHKQSD